MSHNDLHSRASGRSNLNSFGQSGRFSPLEDEVKEILIRAARKEKKKSSIFGNPQLIQRLLEEGFSYGMCV